MFCSPVMLCLLNCYIETIQVTKGCKYFPQEPHVGHPCPMSSFWLCRSFQLEGSEFESLPLASSCVSSDVQSFNYSTRCNSRIWITVFCSVLSSSLSESSQSSISVVPQVCSADPTGSMTSSQGIHGYISVMATLRFT